MKRLIHILFWSILAAAFIGPGTVTTAASAGANYGYALLWALLFSTIATLVLQEASARVTVVSGWNLGEAIRQQFTGGAQGILVLLLILGAIVFGCSAYEAGNILGAVAGAKLGTGLPPLLLTGLIGLAAAVVLWFGSPRAVAYILSLVVAFMGIAFLVTAWLLKPSLTHILSGSLVPKTPRGSGLLILGLVGTTVVPYNLFLGSGMAKGQHLPNLRFGLSVSILLGGLISMGVLVVGHATRGVFSFESLSSTLSRQLGAWSGIAFAFGLLAAGLSSAITAPLAAAITAKSLFERNAQAAWHAKSWRYRSVWMGVLFIGMVFGVADVQPIPAIILAQALNGVLLPFVAIYLLLVVNDRTLMGADGLNGPAFNLVMSAVVGICIILGMSNVMKATAAAFAWPAPQENGILLAAFLVTLTLAYPTARAIYKRRAEAKPVGSATRT